MARQAVPFVLFPNHKATTGICCKKVFDCRDDPTRPFWVHTHLLDVDTAVLDDEESSGGYEALKTAQSSAGRLVRVRTVVDNQTRRSAWNVSGDQCGKRFVQNVAFEQHDVPESRVDLFNRFASPTDVEINRDDQRISDATVRCKGAKAVAEPQRASS